MIKDTFEPFYINSTELRALAAKYVAEGNFSPSTAATYKTGLKRFLDYHSSHIFDFTVEAANLYLAYLKSQNFTSAAIYSYFSALKNFFSFLVEEKFINKNPAKRITFKYIKSKQAEINIPCSYIDIILKNDSKSNFIALRNKAILYLASRHGFNVKELCSLNVKDAYYYGGKVYCRRVGKDNIKVESEEKLFLLDYIRQRNLIPAAVPSLFISKNIKGVSPLTLNAANKIIAAYANRVKNISGLNIKPSALKKTKS